MQRSILIFISKSEGWPKVVAESMWWGCIPISKPVSCIPEMLGYGKRGFISSIDIESIGRAVGITPATDKLHACCELREADATIENIPDKLAR